MANIRSSRNGSVTTRSATTVYRVVALVTADSTPFSRVVAIFADWIDFILDNYLRWGPPKEILGPESTQIDLPRKSKNSYSFESVAIELIHTLSRRDAYEAKMRALLSQKRKASQHHHHLYDSDDDMDDVLADEDEFETAFPLSEALRDLVASGYESDSGDDSETELTKIAPSLPIVWTKEKIDLIRKVTQYVLIEYILNQQNLQ